MQWEDTIRMIGASLLYGKCLEKEVGEKEAFAIMEQWAEEFASKGIAETKKEHGITGTSVKDAFECLKKYHADMSIEYAIEEETPDAITYRVKKCVMPATCGMSGWDCNDLCHRLMAPLCAKVAPVVGDAVKWELVEFNPNIEVGCRYKISKK